MDLSEVNYESIEYNGKEIIYACYLNGKQLNRIELEILESTLWNVAN
jgi:hypothetical protein